LNKNVTKNIHRIISDSIKWKLNTTILEDNNCNAFIDRNNLYNNKKKIVKL